MGVIFELLGDVRGKLILDAGCGQGYLARLLASRGALVTGVEPASGFFAYAHQREVVEQRGITYYQADLSTWMPTSTAFDAVVANMVFMEIPDYPAALATCVAALKPGGALIFSVLHPCFEEAGSAWSNKGYVETREYFDERPVPQTYGTFIHRPLSTYLNSVIAVGCTLRTILEPRLDHAVAQQHDAERYWSVPGYVVIAATKNSENAGHTI